jgi:carbon monoxide dehydrogenase subunit G
MTSIRTEIRINAPREKVWTVLADLGAIQQFNPGVKKSYYTSESRQGVGASRVCELRPLGAIEESALDWQEGKSFTLDIRPLSKAPPFKKATGRFQLDSVGQKTRVALDIDYTLRFGLLGRLLDALMVRPQFRKAVPELLLGLKHHVETGEPVDPAVIKRLKASAGREVAAAGATG